MSLVYNNIIFESIDVTQYNDEDFIEVFVMEFRPWIRKNHGDEVGEYPMSLLVKKYIKAISAELKEFTYTFGNNTSFSKINIADTNVVDIVDVRDSNGNKWYEVPYLGQEMVFEDYPNTEINDPDLYQFKTTVPYILKTIKTPRRFVKKVNGDSTTTIQFGAGDPTANDEQLIPNLKNVGLGLPNSISKLNESFDPTNFLKTKTYGTSPSNTTITVKYLVGGGVSSNVATNTLTTINSISFEEDLQSLTDTQNAILSATKNSVAVDNEVPATGGKGGDTIEEIRENALANFGSQNRAVTAKDYQVRVLSMPTKYGSIAKSYATADGTLDNNSPSSILSSPKALQEFTDLVMGFVEKPDNEEPDRRTIQQEIQKKKSLLAAKR